MSSIYIALGANLSNPKANFRRALDELKTQCVTVQATSGLWQSPSWPPGMGHPDYLNAVAEVSTHKTPDELLNLLHAIEDDFGRERSVRNAPRTLDLDILDYGGLVLKNDMLTLPHPRMLRRGFVLFPLAQLAPNWIDPITHLSIDEAIARLPLKDVASMRYMGRL
jgi:2-amino-4-hydroxy-6-hydroxymethyldihydropteridine diphosphokinase